MTAYWPVVMIDGRRQLLPPGHRLHPGAMPPSAPAFAIPFPWPWLASPGDVWPDFAFAELDGGTFSYADAPDFAALVGGSPGGTVLRPDWRDLAPWGAAGGEPGTIVGSNTLDLRHNHAAGSLASQAHSHGAGGLASQAHSHAVGSLAADSAGSHNHGGVTGSVTQVAVGIAGIASQATPTHSHTIGADGAHSHVISGSTGAGGSAGVTGSTAAAGSLAVVGETAAATWNSLDAPETASKLPKRALVRWFVRVSP